MSSEVAINAMWTSMFLLGIIYLFFWRARILIVDWFRDQIFNLRDEMFDEVANGTLSFDHPAYTTLRMTMNGYIRFCHKISLFQLLIFSFLSRNDTKKEQVFNWNWNNAIKDLDSQTLNIFKDYKKQMDVLLIKYLLMSSPFVAVFLFLSLTIGVASKWIEKIRGSSSIQPFLSNMDDSAYATGAI